MRIALFHNLPSGGAKRAVFEWTRRLAARHRVAVYTLSTAAHAFCDLRPFVERQVEHEFRAARLFDSPLGRLNQLQRWRELGWLARAHRALARAIDEGGHDVVLAHPCRFTTVPLVLQGLRTPAAYFLHEPVPSPESPERDGRGDRAGWRRHLDGIDPLISLYRRRLEAFRSASLRGAASLLANSQYTRRAVRSSHGLDAHVVRCGVDSEVFQPIPGTSKAHRVLSVGELSPRKGFLFLVEALGLIPQAARPTLRLACHVVDPDERARVERLAAARDVRLEILEGLDATRLVREYNEAAVFAFAAIDEPFGLVALEAMACGAPVVAVREGGVVESVIHGRTGLLVPRDPAQFAQAVGALLTDSALASRYGGGGRVAAEQDWSWDRSTGALERELEALAGGRCRRSSGRADSSSDRPATPGRSHCSCRTSW